MVTSLKTDFAQIFSRCPKNLSCPKFGGAAAPLAPPARTPMPKGMVLGPFWSENGYTLCPFLSGIGYSFRGNYGSVMNVFIVSNPSE